MIYYKVRIKDMYVKNFTITSVQTKSYTWTLKTEVQWTNMDMDAMPVEKDVGQLLMSYFGSSCVLEEVKLPNE